MNKWIAEFELEDGDSMPEHMDLNFKGARLDFHCKPVSDCIPIPEDATNGDVLKKMFPTAKFYCAERLQTAGMPRRNADFDVDWWNAPYKGVSE